MKRLLLIFTIAAGLMLTGCSSDESGHSHGDGTEHTHEQVAHEHNNGEEKGHSHETSETTDSNTSHADHEEEHTHSGETTHRHEGEDTDSALGLDETYDDVRRGAHLTLSYNRDTGSFSGTVKNTTQQALPQVAIVVQLSNGTVLGPTTPVDLEAGESHKVELDASGESFESWNARSEISSSGHSHDEGSDHDHH